MNRRDFMRRLLGGGAAALVGAAIPVSLRPDELAVVEERVTLRWEGDRLVVANPTQDEIVLSGTLWVYLPRSTSEPWRALSSGVAMGTVVPREVTVTAPDGRPVPWVLAS